MATENEHTGDGTDDVESVEEEETGQETNNHLLDFPNVLAALQNAEALANLPPVVKRRIKSLKKLQLEANTIEAQFFKEVHALECKYHLLYTPLYEKRSNIVNGIYEPTDEESQWPSDDEEEMSNELKEKAKIEEITDKEQVDENVKGIPNFWLTIFRNVSILSDMVQTHDEPILKHLIDVKLVCVDEPMGFKLEFHFSPNEYFTNTILTKEYSMRCQPDADEPLDFEGPEIHKSIGCTINWNKGKNVTMKTLKKKQKHKSRGVVRTVTKTVPVDSFFNFFNPPAVTDENNVDEDLQRLLTVDFELGHFFRERIITRAVLYFTGDIVEDEEEDFEEEEEDEDEEDEDDGVKELSKSNAKDQNCKQQ